MKKAVLAWTPVIEQLISERGYPFGAEVVRGVIQIESGGVPGITNQQSGASGLMQVMPITLKSYNNANPDRKYTLIQMRSGTNGRAQIDVGMWVLGHYWRRANSYLSRTLDKIPIDQLVRIADLYYAAGPGKVEPKLDTIEPKTYDNLKSAFPNFQPFVHADKLWNLIQYQKTKWNIDKINNWLGLEDSRIYDSDLDPQPNPPISIDDHASFFVIGAIIILVGWYYLQKDKS